MLVIKQCRYLDHLHNSPIHCQFLFFVESGCGLLPWEASRCGLFAFSLYNIQIAQVMCRGVERLRGDADVDRETF